MLHGSQAPGAFSAQLSVSVRKGDDREPPNRLVYLLDHEYTQRGLSWGRLKGADAERAALLRAAADDAGCEAVLALGLDEPLRLG